jgi:hypothetical protein
MEKSVFSVREVLFLISLITQPFLVDKIFNSNFRCPKRTLYIVKVCKKQTLEAYEAAEGCVILER